MTPTEHARTATVATVGCQLPLLRGDRKRILSFVTEIEPRLTGPEADRWLQRIDYDYPLVRALFDDAKHREDFVAALKLAVPLWRYWHKRGRFSEGANLLEEILAMAEGADDRLYALGLHACGTLAFFNGFPDLAVRRLHEALAVWQRLGDRDGERRTRSNLAMIAHEGGEDDEAGAVLKANLDVARRQGDDTVLLKRLLNAAKHEISRRDAEAARKLLDERMDIARRLGQPAEIAQTQAVMATVELLVDDTAAARSYAQCAAAYFTAVGDARWASFAFRLLGRANQNEFAYDEALIHYVESLRLAKQSGDLRELIESLSYLAELEEAMGNTESAAVRKRQASALRESSRVTPSSRVITPAQRIAAEQGRRA